MEDISYILPFLTPCMLIALLIGGAAGWNIRKCSIFEQSATLKDDGSGDFSIKK